MFFPEGSLISIMITSYKSGSEVFFSSFSSFSSSGLACSPSSLGMAVIEATVAAAFLTNSMASPLTTLNLTSFGHSK